VDPSIFFQTVIHQLERLAVPYFVTGGFASIAYGEPRLTLDIGIVVAIGRQHIQPICDAFPMPEYYISDDAIRLAIEHRQIINVINPVSGLKADFMIAGSSAFERSRFDRVRLIQQPDGFCARFASPQDMILNKLLFAQKGLPDRHLRDIAGIVMLQGDKLDHTLIAQ
jgi:hypothetical protein